MDEHTQRRNSFNQLASLYDEVRPTYPTALFDDIITLSNLPTDGRILEVGCGTGQATLPFANRGYAIECIELGDQLAEIARLNLISYPNAQVMVGDFETFTIEREHYDLLLSATAFHWIDPTVRFKKSYEILKPGGSLAVFWTHHVQTEISWEIFTRVQEVYARVVPEMTKKYKGLIHPDDFPTVFKQEIENSGYFSEVTIRKHLWKLPLKAETYTNLLNTFSDHRQLDEPICKQLFDEIRTLIDTEFDGAIVKEYLAILYLAHRK